MKLVHWPVIFIKGIPMKPRQDLFLTSTQLRPRSRIPKSRNDIDSGAIQAWYHERGLKPRATADDCAIYMTDAEYQEVQLVQQYERGQIHEKS
jgi:hypothetical protein